MAESQSLINPHDIVEVANIDIDCNLEDPEVHPNGKGSFVVYYGRRVDSSGQIGNQTPISIDAGKTRMFPRYLANHYAKHLANHMLHARELQVSDRRERPKLMQEIIRGVKESFAGVPQSVEVDAAPPREPIITVSEAERVVKETKTREKKLAEPVITEGAKPKPTRKQLFAELKVLGVETTGRENVDDLMKKVEKFAYGD